MATIQFGHGTHKWDKKNLVSLSNGQDIQKCKLCGVEVRSSLNGLLSSGKLTREELYTCKKAPILVGGTIIVNFCNATGKEWANMTPRSVHELIPLPQGEVHSAHKVWVMGVTAPVTLIEDEFTLLEGVYEEPATKAIKSPTSTVSPTLEALKARLLKDCKLKVTDLYALKPSQAQKDKGEGWCWKCREENTDYCVRSLVPASELIKSKSPLDYVLVGQHITVNL